MISPSSAMSTHARAAWASVSLLGVRSRPPLAVPRSSRRQALASRRLTKVFRIFSFSALAKTHAFQVGSQSQAAPPRLAHDRAWRARTPSGARLRFAGAGVARSAAATIWTSARSSRACPPVSEALIRASAAIGSRSRSCARRAGNGRIFAQTASWLPPRYLGRAVTAASARFLVGAMPAAQSPRSARRCR